MSSSQDIEAVTTAIFVQPGQPDSKTRRYDRQLRLWAASGQTALESARILVISASASSTSILKNLVLPGIGHFTILDPEIVQPEDVGNNFFLEGLDSVGKSRAEEATRLLTELNENVQGVADTRAYTSALSDASYLASFSLIIAHNLAADILDSLSELLWSDSSLPPLIVVRSAGFFADFYIQIHEHTIIDSHPENGPSLRIDKPFPALLDHAIKLDFDGMDITDHGHIPYVVILVRALEEWKSSRDGKLPKTYKERSEFKQMIAAMKRKPDEENLDEAIAQSYRAWTETKVPSGISDLFLDPKVTSIDPSSSSFYQLLHALKQFTEQAPYTLPISSTLPDMKADTANYIHLQKLYKAQAELEKEQFLTILREQGTEADPRMVEDFLRNAHGLKIIRGSKWTSLIADSEAIASSLASSPSEAAIHLGLSSLSRILAKDTNSPVSKELLESVIHDKLGGVPELPEVFESVIGELVRTPTADLPNTAAFLGGLVAQEAIKIITEQYVPIQGICVVDLIRSVIGTINA